MCADLQTLTTLPTAQLLSEAWIEQAMLRLEEILGASAHAIQTLSPPENLAYRTCVATARIADREVPMECTFFANGAVIFHLGNCTSYMSKETLMTPMT